MTTTLRPFFSYYGGKWRAAPRYPAPEYSTIVEPFAGSAGYSLRYPDRQIHLIDKDPVVAGVWDYLIHVRPGEILRLPIGFDHVDEVPGPDEARHLVGFWLNKGMTSPCLTPSKWMRTDTRGGATYWGEEVRFRIASQLRHIRHWTVTCGSYADAPDIEATTFVDPPYSTRAGSRYRHSEVDYRHLRTWCADRRGQVIVCEQEGSTWMPFEPMGGLKSTRGSSSEVVWVS